jgi:predicted transcriptional regulator
MFAGDNGVLYTVDGRHVNAIGDNGSLLWSLEIPDKYRLPSYGNGSCTMSRDYGLWKKTYTEDVKTDVVTASDQPWSSDSAVVLDGNLYILLRHETPVILNGLLLAVASNGSMLWSLPFVNGGGYGNGYGIGSPIGVDLHGGILYVYSDFGGGISQVAMNGTIVGSIYNVVGKPAVCDDGTVYVRKGDFAMDPAMQDYVAPFLQAWGANGTLLWRRSFADFGINESGMPMQYEQPYLRNGTLYLWSNDGFAALDTNGSLKFRYYLPQRYLLGCGFDQNDTLYLSYSNDTWYPISNNHSGMVIMRPDGTIVSSQFSDDGRFALAGLNEVPDGIFYGTSRVMPFEGVDMTGSTIFANFSSVPPIPDYYTTYRDGLVVWYLKNNSGRWDFPRGLCDLDTFDVTARDLATGDQLWSNRLPLDTHNNVLDQNNTVELTFDVDAIRGVNSVPESEWYAYYGIAPHSTGIRSDSWAGLTVSNGTMYVNMWSYDYQYPPFYHKARIAYAGGLYAFGLNGTLKWSLSTDTRVVAVQEVNGTVYYGTGGGRISAVRAGAVAGALVAGAYLFLRFFLFGAVTRARARIDKNSNRGAILDYIRDNPGVSQYDIARGLEMNPGTVRYHLMILGLNHRIASFKADEKFLRYFTNSGTYGPGDQMVISLMRREPLCRIIVALKERPGQSNLELSRVLDAHESSTMRNLKELIDRGVVTRSLLPDGKIAYSLSSDYIVQVVGAFGQLHGQAGNPSGFNGM